MPAHGRNRRGGQTGPTREMRKLGRVAFERRAIPRPSAPVLLRPSGAGTAVAGTAGKSGEQWELQCRDGWDWRSSGAGLVLVRVATISPDRALVLQGWLERIKSPAVWWAVSRELQSPGSTPEVEQELRASPWLTEVLPVILEASMDGIPPQPVRPANRSV